MTTINGSSGNNYNSYSSQSGRPPMPQLTTSEQSLVDKAMSEMGTDSSAAQQDLATAAAMFASTNSSDPNAGRAFGMAVDGYERSQGTSQSSVSMLNTMLPEGDEPGPPPQGLFDGLDFGGGAPPPDGQQPPNFSNSSSTASNLYPSTPSYT